MESVDTKPNRKWLKLFLGLFLAVALVGGGLAYYFYHQVFGINVVLTEDTILTIPKSHTSLEQLAQLLEQEKIIQNKNSFLFTAQQMSYQLKTGKYTIPKSTTSNRRLVRVLQGRQLAVRLTFHNLRLKQQLAGYVSRQIEADSSELITLLNDSDFLAQFGYTPENVMAAFIPNTYEMYWDCDAKTFWKKMLKENKKFWNQERLDKAAALDMTPIEVYTLASIVECESQYKPERPKIAGVYLNRLQKEGWKLEADPTVVFAVGDFSIKRVLDRHLETDSPYNTYKYAGLPPGPIYMSSINAIDAVLNAEKHSYMFFCAKPPEAGQSLYMHAFAKTHRAHINNAKKYWNWIRRQ
ncbi:endolytic transglycosylase MltG [Aureispira anguillae]|uniref:Endolytic murein transglycosylase n=1 Tax=Aureispira anguillae TaxID=2864201 RepID=A0A915YL85_9BACT|nr:endolytic transglycosylase MltG [Aureispira anguillae]BDS15150.1 endolytic transglycosylase MltG [Aureispira anguillae]